MSWIESRTCYNPSAKGHNMARSTSRPAFSFKHSVLVEVHRPKFEFLESFKYLDFRRFEKGKHRVEVGSLSGACCRETVRLIVNKGMATGVEIEACRKVKRDFPSGALVAITKEAIRRAGAASEWKSLPLAQVAGLPKSIFERTCVHICILGHCFLCCTNDGNRYECSEETIYTGPLNAWPVEL